MNPIRRWQRWDVAGWQSRKPLWPLYVIITVALLMVLLPSAQAQTSFYTDRALQQVNVLGTPEPLTAAIPFAFVRVCSLPLTQQSPCLPLATVTDINGNPLSNSIGSNFGQTATDITGRFTFGCTLGNNYQVQVAASASNTPATNYPITCPGVGSNPQFNSLILNAVALPNTTSSSIGVATWGGTPFIHDFGNGGALGAWVGLGAGNFTFTGANNNGFGYHSLQALTNGAQNNAFGTNALQANTTASQNNAFGFGALFATTSGGGNSAFGNSALTANTTGGGNAAFGASALLANTTASNNSAFGNGALASLVGGTTTNNTAIGQFALNALTTGSNNNGFGVDALLNLTTGSNNLALGFDSASTAGAGSAYTGSESNNIVIENAGVVGESNIIRLGKPGTHTNTYLSGIVAVGNTAGTGSIAGDLTVQRSSTSGALFMGTDGSQIFRSGNTATFSYGTVTATFPAVTGTLLNGFRTSVAGSTTLLAANSCGDAVTVTVTGATTSMFAYASAVITSGLVIDAKVSAVNTVTVQYCNVTTAGITPAAATLQVAVIQ